MPLRLSTRIGPYEITGTLGAGGMGEVYRARDTKLNREVALKVLPDSFANDADRVARFTREAQTLASLNHPNIAQIHGLEESSGARALVMELVEGDDLSLRIAPGAIPIVEALPIARQIAEALDAAHEKGIVHRDLKPANVMVTTNGVVKVLDFGLAKHLARAADASQVETTVVRTEDGALVGTVAYMSPEQARGYAVDKRADIWAFGCVLFEMLTGRRAFGSTTSTDTLAAIVHSEPDWSALPSNTPSGVERLLRRCLEKDLRRRLRDIGEVSAYVDERSMGPREERGDARVQPVRDKRGRWMALAAAAIVLSALGVAAVVWRAGTPSPGIALCLAPSMPFTFDPGLTTDPTLSADGRLIAYASNRRSEGNLDVYVQQMKGGAAIRLTDDVANDDQPDVSPDGSLVAFHSDRHPAGIYIASALGGTARLLAPEGRAPRFSPDGRFVAFETGTVQAPIAVINTRKVFIVPATGGAPVQLATNLVNAGGPTWAPDGKSLLVLGRKGRTGADVALEWWRVPSRRMSRQSRPAPLINSLGAVCDSRLTPPRFRTRVRGRTMACSSRRRPAAATP